MLPTVFGLLVCGVYLCCVVGGGVEDGGGCYVCFFSFCADGSMWFGFPGGAWLREPASRSWNKVLRASLFFADVHSGGGVGSMSLGLPGSQVSVEALSSSSLCIGVLLGRRLLAMFFSLFWRRAGRCLLLAKLCAAVAGQVKARGRTSFKGPMADVHASRMSCSNPMFGVRSLSWWGKASGLQLRCSVLRMEDRRQCVPRKEMNSKDLLVISTFFWVLCVREGCTVLLIPV